MDAESSRSWINSAEHAYRSGDYLTAANLYEQVAQGYQNQGQIEHAAEQKNNAAVCCLRAGNADQALLLVKGTSNVFSQAGDIKRQAVAVGNQAAAFEALGRLDESERSYLDCVQLLKDSGLYEELFDVYSNLSSVQIRRRKYLQAIASMNSGLEYKQTLTLRQRILKSLLRIPIKMLNVG